MGFFPTNGVLNARNKNVLENSSAPSFPSFTYFHFPTIFWIRKSFKSSIFAKVHKIRKLGKNMATDPCDIGLLK